MHVRAGVLSIVTGLLGFLSPVQANDQDQSRDVPAHLRHIFPNHKADTSMVDAVAFSPDGKALASTTIRVMRLWDVVTGKELATLESRGGRNRLGRKGVGEKRGRVSRVDFRDRNGKINPTNPTPFPFFPCCHGQAPFKK
jgi:WD40 repeat protein